VTNAKAGQSPHNHFPSLAFDIVFTNQYGVKDWSESLFKEFAGVISEIDSRRRIIWGGNFESIKDLPHFELKEWREFSGHDN
jgi:peptidoglycan L-alanyl-D-glutamate endopeptidase CwlK